MNTLRLMSQNQWNVTNNLKKWEEMGLDCSAKVRMKGHLQIFKELMPDVVGGQEVNKDMQPILMLLFQEEKLPYTMIWGNYVPIFYRADKLELLDHHYLLFPVTMDGYEGKYNDALSKACNIAVFRSKESRKIFIFGTAHLWWENDSMTPGSSEMRREQVKMSVEQMEKLQKLYGSCPMIFCGDLNDVYHSPCVDYLQQEAGFLHAYHAATEYRHEGMGYNGCGGNGPGSWWTAPFERAIDHILVRDLDKDAVKRFDRYCPDYYLSLSDHAPVYIDLSL